MRSDPKSAKRAEFWFYWNVGWFFLNLLLVFVFFWISPAALFFALSAVAFFVGALANYLALPKEDQKTKH